MQNEACRNGVTGVPFTIVENKWAIAGGQSAEVYVQVRQTPPSLLRSRA
jgi:predicted DsbA family dithiol-disulfide isomerase